AAGTVLVIDNGDPGYEEWGTWLNSGLQGYNHSTTRYSNAGNSWVRWTPSEAAGFAAGLYRVSIYIVRDDTVAPNVARFSVNYDGGTTTVIPGGTVGFQPLGIFPFSGSSDEYVEILRLAGNARADAVQFERLENTLTLHAASVGVNSISLQWTGVDWGSEYILSRADRVDG